MINPFTAYTPYLCYISAVTLGANTTLTFTQNHAFVVGSEVQYFIPIQWGIPELNGLTGLVVSLTANAITTTTDSRTFSPFINAVATPPVVIDFPQVLPIGDSNSGYSAPGAVQPIPETIPGAFEAPQP